MKDFLLFFPVAIFYLALKTTLFPDFPLPDVPLLMVFYIAYRKPSVEGAVFAFIIGFIDDAFCGSIIGSTSFALLVTYIAVFLSSKLVQFSTPATRAGGAAAAAVLKGLLTFYILKFAHVSASFVFHVLLLAIATGIVAPAAMNLLTKTSAYLSPKGFKDSET